MSLTLQRPTVKVAGRNGQISLGKRYAGRQVLVEEVEPGVWLVRTASVIPDNERRWRAPGAAAALQAALAWAQAHTATDDGADEVLQRLRDGGCE